MVPFCAIIISLTIFNPRPRPFVFVVTNGFIASSPDILNPIPLSAITIPITPSISSVILNNILRSGFFAYVVQYIELSIILIIAPTIILDAHLTSTFPLYSENSSIISISCAFNRYSTLNSACFMISTRLFVALLLFLNNSA